RTAKALKDLFSRTPFDTDTVDQYGDYLVHGAAMPLPRLARGKYPEFTLPGVTPRSSPLTPAPEDKKPPVTSSKKDKDKMGLPGTKTDGVPEAAAVKWKEVPRSKLPKALQAQLKGKIDFWSYHGLVSAEAGKGDLPGAPFIPGGLKKSGFPTGGKPPE